MRINSDINVLGGLSDFGLISVFLKEKTRSIISNEAHQAYTNIKTVRSIKRFERAINSTLIKFANPNVEVLIRKVYENEGVSGDLLHMLFWNASVNNELLDYLNQNVYFPALFSGRITIKKDEVLACLKELKHTEASMQKWTDSTMNTVARKYLYLIRNFNLMEGSRNKTISNHNISDKVLILFIYWITQAEPKTNLLDSSWLQYCLMEKEIFIQRIMQKKFMKYYDLNYSGDNLKIETSCSYEEIYNALK